MKIFLLHSKSNAQIFVYVVENYEYCNRKASKKPLAGLRILSTAQYIRNMEEIEYHHRLPIQLRFTDADQFGHINNTAYFQYYDTAKIDYVRTVCNIPNGNYAIFAVHVEADFLSQVHNTDRVEVQTAISEIGTKSFTLHQRLVDSDTNEVKCIGKTIMVAFDLARNISIPMLPEWVDAICKYEGRDVRRREKADLACHS
jgi:hypothetical protein